MPSERPPNELSIGCARWNLASRNAADQIAGRRHVVLLAGAENETDRQAEGIDYSMDLGDEPSSGSTESLGLSAPLFTRAPAAWA